MGLGTTSQELLPHHVKDLDNIHITQIACGGGHTLALDSKGRVFGWGRGSSGQLGHGTTESTSQPVHIPTDSLLAPDERVVDIAAGSDFSLLLTSGGRVLATGNGMYGRLGTGNTQSSLVPVPVAKLDGTHVTAISAGTHCGVALAQDSGLVFAWGFGKLVPTPVEPLLDLGITRVAAGQYHGAAVSSSGSLYTWKWGQGSFTLVQPLPKESFVDVAAGDDHSLALSASGVVYSWGNDMYGRLGRPTGGDSLGSGPANVPGVVAGLTNTHVQSIAAGGAHALLITNAPPPSDASSSANGGSCRRRRPHSRSGLHVPVLSKAERLARLSSMLASGTQPSQTFAQPSQTFAQPSQTFAHSLYPPSPSPSTPGFGRSRVLGSTSSATHILSPTAQRDPDYARYVARRASHDLPTGATNPSMDTSAVFWGSPARISPLRTSRHSSPSVAETLMGVANAELDMARSSLEQTRVRSEAMRAEIQRASQAHAELAASLDQSPVRNPSPPKTVRELQASVEKEASNVGAAIQALERELALAHHENGAALDHYENLERELECEMLAKSSVQVDAAALRASLEEERGVKAELARAAGELRAELGRVRAQTTRLSNALDSAESALISLRIKRDSMLQQLQGAAEEEALLTSEVADLEAGIEAKTGTIHEARASLAKLGSDHERLKDELEVVVERKASQDARVMALQAQVDEAVRRKNEVDAQVSALCSQLGEAEGGYAALSSEFKAKSDELDAVREDIARVRTGIATLESETSSAKTELDAESGTLSRASAQRDALLDQVSATKTARMAMEKEVLVLQRELEEAQEGASQALDARNKVQRALEAEQNARREAMDAKTKLEEALELERESRFVALASKERSALALAAEADKRLALEVEGERLARETHETRESFKAASAAQREAFAYQASLKSMVDGGSNRSPLRPRNGSSSLLSPSRVADTKARVAALLSTLDPEHAPATAASIRSGPSGGADAVAAAKDVLSAARSRMNLTARLEAVDAASPAQLRHNPYSVSTVQELLNDSVDVELESAAKDVAAAKAKIDGILAQRA